MKLKKGVGLLLVAALLISLLGTVFPSGEVLAASLFEIGDRVEVSGVAAPDGLLVRAGPGSAYDMIGGKWGGDRGTVVDGPVNGWHSVHGWLTWYKVKWDNAWYNPDHGVWYDTGWSAEGGFKEPPIIITFIEPDVGTTWATLKLYHNFNEFGSGHVQFGYRRTGTATWSYTGWQDASGVAIYEKTVANLDPGTKYEYRAWLTYWVGEWVNRAGLIFEFETQQDTDPAGPVSVATHSATSVGETQATLRGAIAHFNNNPSAEIRFWYKPTAGGSWTSTTWVERTSTTTYSQTVYGLAPDTEYEFYAQGRGSIDTTLETGDTLPFKTLPSDPDPAGPVSVATYSAQNEGQTQATLRGAITHFNNNPSAEIRFWYKPTAGGSWTSTTWVERTSTTTYSQTVYGLAPDTEYEFYAQGRGSTDTTLDTGSTRYFKTLDSDPDPAGPVSVATYSATNVGETQATLRGAITYFNNNPSAELRFRYREQGTTTWTYTTWTTRTSTTIYSRIVTDLTPGTDYEFQAEGYGSVDTTTGWGVTEYFTTDTVATGNAPIARASDISGQEDVMHPDTPYTVAAKYFDLDGRDDLKYCYLRLLHPNKELTMMWNQATDDFWVYEGEQGENYLAVSGTSTQIAEGGLEGYQLAWTFSISDQWPEAENAIDFGVYAWDDSNLKSADWDYDDTKASFFLLASIAISPQQATVTVGEDTSYTAEATDTHGNTFDVTAQTAFSIDEEAGGTWVGNTYTSECAGEWTVTGTYRGLTDTARLDVRLSEQRFQSPYKFSSEYGWDRSFLVGRASHTAKVDRDAGTGDIQARGISGLGGDGQALAQFRLSDSWVSDQTGTTNIAARFNINEGVITWAQVSIFGVSGQVFCGITLEVLLTVYDATESREVFREGVSIYDRPPEWRIIARPDADSVRYEDTEHVVQGLVELQKNHHYTWEFTAQVHTWVISVGPIAYAVANGFASIELAEVVIGPPPPIPHFRPVTSEFMHALLASPADILVIDPEGRRTGFDSITKEEVNEIPDAWYSGQGVSPQLVEILGLVPGDWRFLVSGTDMGEYNLSVLKGGFSNENPLELAAFQSVSISTSTNQLHEYIVDWDALAQDEKGVTVYVDSDGDGVFERSFTTGFMLTAAEAATGTGTAFFTPSHGIIEELQAVPVPADPPTGVSFPHGLFSFNVTGINPGDTVTLTIDLPEPVPTGTRWWKYQNGEWYSLPNETDNGDSTMTITLTDGGLGDADGVADGVITDPGGPGVRPLPPVGGTAHLVNRLALLAPWIALAAIMAGAGLLVLRRRRA